MRKVPIGRKEDFVVLCAMCWTTDNYIFPVPTHHQVKCLHGTILRRRNSVFLLSNSLPILQPINYLKACRVAFTGGLLLVDSHYNEKTRRVVVTGYP